MGEIAITGSDTARLHKRVARIAALAGPLAGKRVLDCGCGAGAYAREYARLGARVIGVEYQRDKLRDAPRGVPSLWLVTADAAALPLPSGSVELLAVGTARARAPRGVSDLRDCLRCQTFENLSGTQPGFIGAVMPALRRVAEVVERVPGCARCARCRSSWRR